MAGLLGFEPRLAEPESAVLPIERQPSKKGFFSRSAFFCQAKRQKSTVGPHPLCLINSALALSFRLKTGAGHFLCKKRSLTKLEGKRTNLETVPSLYSHSRKIHNRYHRRQPLRLGRPKYPRAQCQRSKLRQKEGGWRSKSFPCQ